MTISAQPIQPPPQTHTGRAWITLLTGVTILQSKALSGSLEGRGSLDQSSPKALPLISRIRSTLVQGAGLTPNPAPSDPSRGLAGIRVAQRIVHRRSAAQKQRLGSPRPGPSLRRVTWFGPHLPHMVDAGPHPTPALHARSNDPAQRRRQRSRDAKPWRHGLRGSLPLPLGQSQGRGPSGTTQQSTGPGEPRRLRPLPP